MSLLLQKLKKRRLTLGLKQSDMMSRIGISRQQFQRLESKGNPSLSTLELIAEGLDCKVLLVPNEQLAAVNNALAATSLTEIEPSAIKEPSATIREPSAIKEPSAVEKPSVIKKTSAPTTRLSTEIKSSVNASSTPTKKETPIKEKGNYDDTGQGSLW